MKPRSDGGAAVELFSRGQSPMKFTLVYESHPYQLLATLSHPAGEEWSNTKGVVASQYADNTTPPLGPTVGSGSSLFRQLHVSIRSTADRFLAAETSLSY